MNNTEVRNRSWFINYFEMPTWRKQNFLFILKIRMLPNLFAIAAFNGKHGSWAWSSYVLWNLEYTNCRSAGTKCPPSKLVTFFIISIKIFWNATPQYLTFSCSPISAMWSTYIYIVIDTYGNLHSPVKSNFKCLNHGRSLDWSTNLNVLFRTLYKRCHVHPIPL